MTPHSCKLFVIFIGLFMNSLFAQTIWEMNPLEVRNLINKKIMSIQAEQPEVHNIIDTEIVSYHRRTPLRIYYPNAEKHLPLVLLIHGGGWVAGSIDTHDNMARYLCQNSKVIVLSVGYENSPENKFPGHLEQCYDALLWAYEKQDILHANGSKIAVVGDSAGGNMAAALCLLTRDRKGPSIHLQVLLNPCPNLTCRGTLERQNDSLDESRWFVTQYVTHNDDVYSPYASPFLASHLQHLPPALVILAENDALYTDGEEYADRLTAFNIPTIKYIQHGVGHLAGNAARASKLAQESLDIAVAALRNF